MVINALNSLLQQLSQICFKPSTENSIQVTLNSGYVGIFLNSYGSKLKDPSYIQYVKNSPGKGIQKHL